MGSTPGLRMRPAGTKSLTPAKHRTAGAVDSNPRKEERSMAEDKLKEKLADYVEDAHAMEQNDLKMIDSMISTTDDPQVKEMLQSHKRETEEHERRLRERLDAMGRGTSARKQVQAVGAALLKGVGDQARLARTLAT